MLKMFCDLCEKEIKRNYVSNRLRLKYRKMVLEVVVGKEYSVNAGQLCKKCLLTIIEKGEENE